MAVCTARTIISRAGERRSEARGSISFGGPIGPENTSRGGGRGGGFPLRLIRWAPYYTLGPRVYPLSPALIISECPDQATTIN